MRQVGIPYNTDPVYNHYIHRSKQSPYSCESLLLKLTDTWLDTMDKGDLIGLLLVDFCKAFDLVNHQLLIKKISIYGAEDITLK